MSTEIMIQFEVRNMLIMKDTLKELGHNFNEINEDVVEIQRPYRAIRIDSKAGSITFDSDHKKEVNTIKQTYVVNFYRDQAISEGKQFNQVKNADGSLDIFVTNG